MDCIRIDSDNRAAEIWPDTAKASLVFHADVMARIVEVAPGSVALGDRWTGTGFQSARPPEPTFGQIKAALCAELDAEAERQRLRYVTAGAGKAAAYQAKRAEVDRWIVAGRPSDAGPAAFPWAGDRAALLSAPNAAVPVAAVLAEWEQAIGLWSVVGRAIEAALEAGKAAVQAAPTETDARAARAAVAWPA
jgi:hypothetical protein